MRSYLLTLISDTLDKVMEMVAPYLSSGLILDHFDQLTQEEVHKMYGCKAHYLPPGPMPAIAN